MGKFFNKIRQVFNIFLINALIGLAAAVFVYFLTTPEQRAGTTFWISVGFLIFALVYETLTFSGIAMRSHEGRDVPVGFTQIVVAGIYFVFVIVVSVWNALSGFTVLKYSLIHLGGLVVFFVPMMLINMFKLKQHGSDRRQQSEGRQNLSSMASKVAYIVDDLKAAGLSQSDLSALINLSEKLRYSDPTPASGKIERALDDALKNLQSIAAKPEHDLGEILRACTIAERALTERNEAVKNSK